MLFQLFFSNVEAFKEDRSSCKVDRLGSQISQMSKKQGVRDAPMLPFGRTPALGEPVDVPKEADSSAMTAIRSTILMTTTT